MLDVASKQHPEKKKTVNTHLVSALNLLQLNILEGHAIELALVRRFWLRAYSNKVHFGQK